MYANDLNIFNFNDLINVYDQNSSQIHLKFISNSSILITDLKKLLLYFSIIYDYVFSYQIHHKNLVPNNNP